MDLSRRVELRDIAKKFVDGFESQGLYAVFDPLEERSFIRPADKEDAWTPLGAWLLGLAEALDVSSPTEIIGREASFIADTADLILRRRGGIEA